MASMEKKHKLKTKTRLEQREPESSRGRKTMPTVCERSSCVSRVPPAGGRGPKKDEKIKVLRMSLPIVESLSGLQESIFTYLEAPNSILVKNLKIDRILLNYPNFPLAHVGPMAVWGPLGCCYQFDACAPLLLCQFLCVQGLQLYTCWATACEKN